MPQVYTASSTTGTIWPLWVNATNTATTSAGTTGTIWRHWVTSDTTGTMCTVTPIWANWVNGSNTITTTGSLAWANWNNTSNSSITLHPETPEQVTTRNQRYENERKIRAEEDQKRIRAEERATQLLVSVLSEEQCKDFAAHGYFFVDAPSGRRYRIDKGRSGNIKVIDRVTGVWTESLCVHQRDSIPIPDTMLMQKLLLETGAEEELRRVANITRKNGGYDYGQGILDGERLAQVIPFAPRQAA